jgi:hypothetical protein
VLRRCRSETPSEPPGARRPRRRQRSGDAARGGARAQAPRQLAIIEASCAGVRCAGSGGRGRHRSAPAATGAKAAPLCFPSPFPSAPRRSAGALPGERDTRCPVADRRCHDIISPVQLVVGTVLQSMSKGAARVSRRLPWPQ